MEKFKFFLCPPFYGTLEADHKIAERTVAPVDRREEIIRLWFRMWLEKRDLGIEDIFDPGAVYIESWGPEYRGRDKIRLWFDEWNTRGTVLRWDIRQFFHREDQTVAEWYFENVMADGRREPFEGLSLIRWTGEGKIASLQEFGCNIRRYDPYRDGPVPRFRETGAPWF